MSSALQMAVIIAIAPLAQGVMKQLRARLQGRPGPSILQPYRDLRKLWWKEALVAEDTSPIVGIAPGVALGVALTFAAMVPPVFGASWFPSADAIALALVLALGRFIAVLAALDTRSGFSGMAASREMTFGALTEAPLLLALLSAALGGNSSLTHLHAGGSAASGLLAAGALMLVMLCETARVPVDNQETHYELTMIHEGLVLEYSGWQLAATQLAAYIRQASFFVLAAWLLPFGGWVVIAWCIGFLILMPIIETAYAKMRLFEVPQLFTAALVLGIAAITIQIMGIAKL